ncbi:MAG: FHA domain-containing protein [bacterium]|nr:FHA domain-containing protein [bacterium]
MGKCDNCKSEIDKNDKFCQECGSLIEAGIGQRQYGSNDISKIDKEILQGSINISSRADQVNDGKNLSTDCKHFKIEWNRGSSVFLTNANSTLQFRITPLSKDAKRASEFKTFVRFSEDDDFTEHKLRFRNISFARILHINYRPKSESIGVSQGVDIHFSYKLNDDLYCFEQQILIDVYPQTESNDNVIKNLTIKIGEINQHGKAGDPNINLLNGLCLSKKSIHDLLNSLKRADLWVTLELFQAIPLEPEHYRKLNIPSVPNGKYTKIAIEINKKVIYLFYDRISAGRNRENDLTLRNGPKEGEKWNDIKLRDMNLNISGKHFELGIDENGAWILDCNSTNGIFLDNIKLDNAVVYLDCHTDYNLSLASPELAPKNILLQLRAYPVTHDAAENVNKRNNSVAGIAIKQVSNNSLAALLVNKWIPLSSVLPGAGNLFITYRNNFFAITDGVTWHWLNPGLMITVNGLDIKIKKI